MNNLMLAAISGKSLIELLIWVIVIGVCFWLLNWLVDYIKLGEPFTKILKVILVVSAVVFLINALLTLAGHGFITF